MITKLDKLQGRDIYENTALAKINELVDIVNSIQEEREAEKFEIEQWIGILEEMRKCINIHEKQIDKLQMKLEPEKCETPAENMLTKSLRMDKEFAEDECVRLQRELSYTRKVLDKAKWWLNEIVENHRYTPISTAEMALKEIKGLEQKDIK